MSDKQWYEQRSFYYGNADGTVSDADGLSMPEKPSAEEIVVLRAYLEAEGWRTDPLLDSSNGGWLNVRRKYVPTGPHRTESIESLEGRVAFQREALASLVARVDRLEADDEPRTQFEPDEPDSPTLSSHIDETFGGFPWKLVVKGGDQS